MYSPKIKKEFIPVLYNLARINRIPMTRLVNEIIEKYLWSLGELPPAQNIVAEEAPENPQQLYPVSAE